MKTNEENLNTKNATKTCQNDSSERNNSGGHREHHFKESKFLWLMISTFYV